MTSLPFNPHMEGDNDLVDQWGTIGDLDPAVVRDAQRVTAGHLADAVQWSVRCSTSSASGSGREGEPRRSAHPGGPGLRRPRPPHPPHRGAP
jgi:hypothetical protein